MAKRYDLGLGLNNIHVFLAKHGWCAFRKIWRKASRHSKMFYTLFFVQKMLSIYRSARLVPEKRTSDRRILGSQRSEIFRAFQGLGRVRVARPEPRVNLNS